MTLTQKILAKKADLETVSTGQLIEIPLDLVMGNDITAPVAIDSFYKNGCGEVFDSEKIALVLDHFVPNKDINAAEQCKTVREFANKYNITHLYDVGEMGIEHALLPEKGMVLPGECVIGADSHTCTYGALSAFSTGVGSTDMAYGMKTGKAWLKVPGAIGVELTGKLNKYTSGKDVILHLIGEIGVDGATYKSLEFFGEGVASLSMDARFTICNMAVEAGAKNGIFPFDDATAKYISKRATRKFYPVEADERTSYEQVIKINLNELKPTVAFPFLPSNTRTPDSFGNVEINQVVIGSCTNGRMSDMYAAAEILKGRHVAKNVRCIIIPATMAIYRKCLNEGLFDVFLDAGAVISTPTCGPCLGGYMGILAAGEKCVATTNRNFTGRMGHVKSEVYLASPFVAAESAVQGRLAAPENQ